MLKILSFTCALALALVLSGKGVAASDDNFAAMNFLDGKPRTAADFAGNTVAVYAFCRT